MSESKNATASNMSNNIKYKRPNGCASWDHVGMDTKSFFFENGDGAISANAKNLALGTYANKIFTANDGNNNSKKELINAMYEDTNSFYEGNKHPTALTGNGLKYSSRRYLLDLIKKEEERKMVTITPSKEEKGGYLALEFDVNAMESLNYYDPSKCVKFYSTYDNDETWNSLPNEWIELYKNIKKEVGQEEKGWLTFVPYSDEGHDVIRRQMEERKISLKELPRKDRMSHKWGKSGKTILLLDKNKNKYKLQNYNPSDRNYPSKKKVEKSIYIYKNPSGDIKFVRKVKSQKGKKIVEKYVAAKYDETSREWMDGDILLGEESEWDLVKEAKVSVCVDYPVNFYDPSDPKFPESLPLNHRPYDEDYYLSKEEKIAKDKDGKPHKVAPENLEELSQALYYRNNMLMGGGLSHASNNIHRANGGHGNLMKKFILYYVTVAFEWNSRTKHTREQNEGQLLDKYIQNRDALINKHDWSPDMIRPEINHHIFKTRWEEGRKAFHELILFKLKYNNGVTESHFKGKKSPIARELGVDDLKAWAKYLSVPIKKGRKEDLMNTIRDKLRDDFLASQPLSSSDYSSSDDESKNEEPELPPSNQVVKQDSKSASESEESGGEQSGSDNGEDEDKAVSQVVETVVPQVVETVVPQIDEGKEDEGTEEDDISEGVSKELRENQEFQYYFNDLWNNNPDFRKELATLKEVATLMEKYSNQVEPKVAIA